jgi:hypothetical protein
MAISYVPNDMQGLGSCPHCIAPSKCPGTPLPGCTKGLQRMPEPAADRPPLAGLTPQVRPTREPAVPRNEQLTLRRVANGFVAYTDDRTLDAERVLVFESRKALLAFLLAHFDEPGEA